MLFIDFETRSRCDLKTAGVYNYAQDGSTDVLCMSYAFDDDDVQTWLPGQSFPERVRNYTGQIRAHNAAFERLIFWYVLQINFKLEQFYCTATQARANCAPGNLEDVGRFASADMRKDYRGAQLIRLLSIPQADGTFREDAELMQEMVRYCEQDVRAMRAVSKTMRDLSDEELADYYINERINDRGVLVDVALCRAAVQYAADEAVEIENLVSEITEGEITSVRSPKMREWVLERVEGEALKLMTIYKDGEKKFSIDKSVRANLLALAEENPDEVPPDVADVIQCADDLWASSVAKFTRLADLSDAEDQRVRGAFVFAGGSATGRASSYGAQVHNFARKCAKNPDEVRHAMTRGHSIVPKYGKRVTEVLKGMLRPALIPAPGNVFVVADWSSIEGRVNPWLSNCPAGEQKLDVFREGLDPYKVNAAASFGVEYDEVTDIQRQVGKVQELACFGAQTQVLTNNGYKAIVEVQITDFLWDGQSWVKHQGVINRGIRATINVGGVEVTPDHLILTGQTWRQARQLASNKQLMILALEVGSDNLPSWVLSELNRVRRGLDMQGFNALVALRRIWSTSTTLLKAHLRAAMFVLKNLRDSGEKISLSMPMLAPMTLTVGGCSIGCLLPKIDATTQTTERTPITAVEALLYTRPGWRTKPHFFATFSRLMGGISRTLSWIALMSIKGMSLATFGSSLSKQTAPTNDQFKRCNGTSSNLKPVFDILSSGPRSRFAILSDQGHLIVHNCGFLGGAGSFATFGRVYGLQLSDAEIARAIRVWRGANPWAIQHGQALEAAYTRAMRNPGYEFPAGRICYKFDGHHLWYMLPSGRVLCYPYAKLESEGVSYAKAAWKPAADAKEWPRARLWSGLAVENVTQAAANDVLRHSLRRLNGVVLHIHDEIVLEIPVREADAAAARLREVMCTPPAWAAGLPLDVEIKIMERYSK